MVQCDTVPSVVVTFDDEQLGKNGPMFGKYNQQILTTLIAMVVVVVGTLSGCDGGMNSRLAAMVADPDAALEFLYPEGVVAPGTSATAIEYIRDTDWSEQGFDTIAQILDGAATAHRDPNDPKSELSALAATDTINLLGARGPDKISPKAYDSLGHILANYIIDVDRAARGTPWLSQHPDIGLYSGLPPGADFDPQALRTVLPQVITDEGAAQQIIRSANVLTATEITFVAPDSSDETVMEAGYQSAELLGYVGGAALAGFDDREFFEGQRALDYYRLFGEVGSTDPAPSGNFATYITNTVTPLGQDYVNTPVPENEAAAGDTIEQFSGATERGLALAYGVPLAEAGRIEATKDVDGNWTPYFPDGKFDPEIARSPDYAARFINNFLYNPLWSALDTQFLSGFAHGRETFETS